MWHDWIAKDKFFAALSFEDDAIAAQVKAEGCQNCGGRLDRANYPRKPRGGWVAAAGEFLVRRLSFCCAASDCRRRATPPSLVFLGRRVYLALAVVVGAMRAAANAPSQPSPSRRTERRWLDWFRTEFPKTDVFATTRDRFMPPLSVAALPSDLAYRFVAPKREPADVWIRVLSFLSPLGASLALRKARLTREA